MKNPQEATLSIKILSNPTRLAILVLLLEAKKDLCVSEIANKVKISQSLASHQLAYLEACGVLEGHRMGQMMCYVPTKTLISKKIAQIIKTLKL